jgi:hypothetical protein
VRKEKACEDKLGIRTLKEERRVCVLIRRGCDAQVIGVVGRYQKDGRDVAPIERDKQEKKKWLTES